MRSLQGKVAVVAGGTRGAGRGISVELGAAGATVYVTGRTTRERSSPMGRRETIEETAELVDRAGGTGIPMRVDHTVPDDVAALFARVRDDHGGLDVLVNDAWGGDPLTEWGKTFWEHDLGGGLRMQQSVTAHLVTSHHGAPLLLDRGGGLVVGITDGAGGEYRGNLYYDLVKSSIIRLALAQAEELRPHGVAAVALTPGFLRSEAMLEHFGVDEDTWRDGARKDPHFAASETPHYVGRAVVALASDDRVIAKSGGVYTSWDLAEEYGFTDLDGSRPHWGRHIAEHAGESD